MKIPLRGPALSSLAASFALLGGCALYGPDGSAAVLLPPPPPIVVAAPPAVVVASPVYAYRPAYGYYRGGYYNRGYYRGGYGYRGYGWR